MTEFWFSSDLFLRKLHSQKLTPAHMYSTESRFHYLPLNDLLYLPGPSREDVDLTWDLLAELEGFRISQSPVWASSDDLSMVKC